MKSGKGQGKGGYESKTTLHAKFTTSKKSEGEADGKQVAAATSPGGKKPFGKGLCNNCGEMGHYAYACTEPA